MHNQLHLDWAYLIHLQQPLTINWPLNTHLLYEKSVFQQQHKWKKKNLGDGEDLEEMEFDEVIEDERLGDEQIWLDEEDKEVIEVDDELWDGEESEETWQWCKKVNPDLC